MRITNKIMQNNNLSNINTNKIYQDILSNQMSTQKKVNRPSDDPVVSIRALRLRGNVTEVSQYYSKNIPDAESWLSVTEDALKNLTSIITDMIKQCTKGADGKLKSEDREIILEQLKALGDEVYSTADADYAGRYVFTGYRTDTSVSFPKAETKDYTITEQLDNSAIDSITVVKTSKTTGGTTVDLTDVTSANYDTIDVNVEDVKAVTVRRIRLAYDNCSPSGTPVPSISYYEKNGNNYNQVTQNATVVHDYDDPYTQAAENPDAVIFVPETGELLLGKDIDAKLMAAKDDTSTSALNEGEIRITYKKSDWQKGDLRPEHYFNCTTTVDGKSVEYNASYLTSNADRQEIEYDVGFNQTIRVNSTADECFGHGIGREVDDLVSAMEEVVEMENIVKTLEDKMGTAGAADAKIIQKRLDAAKAALTLKKDKEQKLFESSISKMQGYLDDANLCITNCGTRSSKLSLIKNRMQTQKTTFETLKSDNEDVDITEVVINLKSAEMTYEAALMATGKVSQTTLLNYI